MTKSGFKKYATNTIFLFGEKIARVVFTITVWVYVARYLGPEQFGLLSYALSFVFLFNMLADLGLEMIIVKELVENPSKANAILGTTFFLKLFGSLTGVLFIAGVMQFLSF